jgi:hypothetical protein
MYGRGSNLLHSSDPSCSMHTVWQLHMRYSLTDRSPKYTCRATYSISQPSLAAHPRSVAHFILYEVRQLHRP